MRTRRMVFQNSQDLNWMSLRFASQGTNSTMARLLGSVWEMAGTASSGGISNSGRSMKNAENGKTDKGKPDNRNEISTVDKGSKG